MVNMSGEDSELLQVDGMVCAVDAENEEQLNCVNPETGEEETVDIGEVDQDELGL